MSFQHTELAAGRWRELPFMEQMANVGSEVERALNWRAKKNEVYSRQALERALELIDLTLAAAHGLPRLTEIARTREVIVDYFEGTNQYGSTDSLWRKYFVPFNYAARRDKGKDV